MPFTASGFATKHNHRLGGQPKGGKAASIANAVMRDHPGLGEGPAIAIASKYAQRHRDDGGPVTDRPQGRDVDVNLTPTPGYFGPVGPLQPFRDLPDKYFWPQWRGQPI